MEIYSSIQGLLNKSISINLIQSEDEIYSRNQIMSLLSLDTFPEKVSYDYDKDLPSILDEIINYAVKEHLILDLFDEKEILSSKIMDVLIPRPFEVNRNFLQKFVNSPESATDYFYELSQSSNYIQTKNIAKNVSFQTNTEFGNFDITINLSKPEKDPRDIEMERKMKSQNTNYPECLLCIENEGYVGRIGHPARSNHRMIRLELTNEKWLLQYSPYLYYNEHCILLSNIHRDMTIDKGTFARLLEFIEKFPHYFIGSNADLPIVGGSILSHDHYQGGNYEFALMKAEDEYTFKIEDYPTIEASIIKWPMSVIRLRGFEKDELINASDYILEKWKSYSDSTLGIEAFSGDTRHNTITPIARMRNGEFEMYLVLRNNRTSDEHPLGIFHPHEDVHHIKKENIGLIEVMGLAVLPARLNKEIEEIEKYLLGEDNGIQPYHISWANAIKLQYESELTDKTVTEIVRTELGKKFLKALEDAGVYKRDQIGKQAFRLFTNSL